MKSIDVFHIAASVIKSLMIRHHEEVSQHYFGNSENSGCHKLKQEVGGDLGIWVWTYKLFKRISFKNLWHLKKPAENQNFH